VCARDQGFRFNVIAQDWRYIPASQQIGQTAKVLGTSGYNAQLLLTGYTPIWHEHVFRAYGV